MSSGKRGCWSRSGTWSVRGSSPGSGGGLCSRSSVDLAVLGHLWAWLEQVLHYIESDCWSGYSAGLDGCCGSDVA